MNKTSLLTMEEEWEEFEEEEWEEFEEEFEEEL